MDELLLFLQFVLVAAAASGHWGLVLIIVLCQRLIVMRWALMVSLHFIMENINKMAVYP